MNTLSKEQIFADVQALCERTRLGAPTLSLASHAKRCKALVAISEALRASEGEILAANARDLAAAAENGVPRVMLDRLALNTARLAAIADAVKNLKTLPDPLEGTESWSRPTGITITRAKVPLGLVAIIYEARPNVTADAAALCIKSGNAVILRGGKEAIETNRAIVNAIKQALRTVDISPDVVGLVEITDRESANALMQMRGLVDVLIPRGGKGLIQNCVNNSRVPVIETGAGNCHVYVDKEADLEKALTVTVNAKCQRPSVCNAAETLLVHRDVAQRFLPALFSATREWNLEFRGCPATCAILPEAKPATEEDFATEYNDYILTVKVVNGVDEAITHIEKYGTRHSEAILTEDEVTAHKFCDLVDAAAVYHNASTRFTDGEIFGFGAEIGISTQKLHARGPMGPEALTTVKYRVYGEGAVRK
ncbi:MAG: glutamate-5-semialdehyde dehydrogenase [Ruminococcaceae bacterium]|nr:glutamate-5-semialdehyde dehydrogenase [Oscillospiraceae bacterium]